MTFVFRHQVKTSRRFVFENIMDLDHVCTLHKKWFRNLRVIVQRPDFVEYRLTSLFYGLRQEIRVRGGPVDENRYWYEFLAPLADMRVDGLMGGPDGALSQIETVTFKFHWLLAPFFWLLRPLFRKQKKDILRDDTALLERVYELDRKGFIRLEIQAPRVVVYGGNGFFGRLVVQDLLRFSSAQITIASRRAKVVDYHGFRDRVRWVQSDLNDFTSVRATIEGAQALVSCVGPYQGQSLNLLEACVENRVPYVDVADDRDFLLRAYGFSSKIAEAGIPALIGCSVVPGLSTLLTQYCRDQFPCANRTKICISPGTRHPRGPGSLLCLLSTVGKEISITENGNPKKVIGWTGRERVFFPPPMGARWVYFVVDVPDYFLQTRYFGVQSVEFKIGSELDALNHLLSGLRAASQFLKAPNLHALVFPARLLIQIASLFGTSQGGMMVEVSSSEPGLSQTVAMCAFAAQHGEVIPAILPSIAAQLILKGHLNYGGVVPLNDWIPQRALVEELSKRNVTLAVRQRNASSWVPCT